MLKICSIVATMKKGNNMKSVLISIQPKWVEKIASGEKTIEVRKSVPKLEIPFKCYIYCTQGKVKDLFSCSDWIYQNRMRVIGEFVCDSAEMVNAKCSDYGIDLFYHDCMAQGCLTESEVDKYFNIPEDKDLRVMKGNGYAWYISDLKIYDKPKDLSEFYRPCPEYYSDYYNGVCSEMCVFHEEGFCKNFCLPIARPPQSWFYVEVGE